MSCKYGRVRQRSFQAPYSPSSFDVLVCDHRCSTSILHLLKCILQISLCVRRLPRRYNFSPSLPAKLARCVVHRIDTIESYAFSMLRFKQPTSQLEAKGCYQLFMLLKAFHPPQRENCSTIFGKRPYQYCVNFCLSIVCIFVYPVTHRIRTS